MDTSEYLSNVDIVAVEEMYELYKNDHQSVDVSWQRFFEGFELGSKNYKTPSNSKSINYPDEFKVVDLIIAYRQRGHLFTKTNPVRIRRQYTPTLDIENFGLSKDDLQKKFQAGFLIGIGQATLKTIVAHLQQTYCQSLGVEFFYIRTPEIVEWLQNTMESCKNTPTYSVEEKKILLQSLSKAVTFEKFIHLKFPGHKSFSLEGAEALIPALGTIIERANEFGILEFVIGMPHRGRLNVLGNILHKPYSEIFSDFEGKAFNEHYLLGDVKYHLGYSSVRKTREGSNIRLSLAPNPSHLEAVDPVVEGIVRSKIDNDYHGDEQKIVPVLLHGDASIAGQGIVYEVLQMSQLEAYKTGGTLHLIVNNQLGFTTNYLDARSSTYCTDIAKTVQVPIFHVNSDDIEAVVYTFLLAIEFRQKFHRDIFIDLLSYRKYGHNEGDEPRYTQPLLYRLIEKHPNPEQLYIKKLIEENVIDESEESDYDNKLLKKFEIMFDASKAIKGSNITSLFDKEWERCRKAAEYDFKTSPDTSIKMDVLKNIAERICYLPEEKSFFRKLVRLTEQRKNMIADGCNIDWAMCELLAYGSIVNEGFSIRFTGEDVERGTFSHRHAVIKIEASEEEYIPLQHISSKQGEFHIYNSLLSEFGVLGFEYGYSLTSPKTLTIWEAQYGDFVNGAQIIIDQFLCSGEEKWNVQNGVVLLLPHGFEGQGPEHSSANINRFLSLCANQNMQIVNCTTPANFFHVLRRQMHRNFRKPLIVFSPKSLLRHPLCNSSLTDLSNDKFHEVIDDSIANAQQIEYVVLCSGKIYYELLEEQTKCGHKNFAIIRLEQLFPLPIEQIKEIQKKYSNAKEWRWAQEEPENFGAMWFLKNQLDFVLSKYISRPASGSPATGSSQTHIAQQKQIIKRTFEK